LRPASGALQVRGDALDGERELFFFMFSAASESRRKHGPFSLAFPGMLYRLLKNSSLRPASGAWQVRGDALDGERELFCLYFGGILMRAKIQVFSCFLGVTTLVLSLVLLVSKV